MQIRNNSKIISVYKPVGISPLDLVKKFQKKYSENKKEKIAYAGRLDPLAEGVVLLIKGEKLKKFDDYLKFNKKYEAEILFGFCTDTYDILGISSKKNTKFLSEEKIENNIKEMKGDFKFTLPPFSSYKIKKKPLFWWALQGRLNEIKIPEKKAFIYSIDILRKDYFPEQEIKREILNKIKIVKGNFRQEKIIKRWEKNLDKNNNYFIFKIKVSCSSGCYIRSIADEVGKKLKSGALLMGLKRTAVGSYKEDNALRL